MGIRVLSRSSVVLDDSTPSSPTTSARDVKSHNSTLSMRRILLLVLPLLSLLGASLTFTLASCNGTFDSLIASVSADDANFPGTAYPLLRTYTGIRVVDEQLTILVAFFSPVVELGNSEIKLFSIFGFGQFGAAWALMMMESMRAGNRGRMVSYITVVGILIQNITYTITIPLYLTLHLLTSPISLPLAGSNPITAIQIPTIHLRLLLLSLTIGYIIPSILMVLPAPSMVSPLNHQRFIALWQAFPIWCTLSHFVLQKAWLAFSSRILSRAEKRMQAIQGMTYLNTSSYVYSFLLAICILTHLPTLILTLLPSLIFPHTNAHSAALAFPSFTSTYIPLTFSPSHVSPSFRAGIHLFLQWDLYIGSLSILIWALHLYSKAQSSLKLPLYRSLAASKQEKIWPGKERMHLGRKVLIWGLLAGPVGVAVVLLWERDVVIGRAKVKSGI